MNHDSLSCFCCLNDLLEKVIAVISETGIEGILKYQIVLVTGFLINHFIIVWTVLTEVSIV